MLKVINYFFGYLRVEYSTKDREKVLQLLLDSKIISWGSKEKEDKDSICILLKDAAYFSAGMRSIGVSYSVISKHGFPALLGKYRRRYGLIAGVIIFAVMIFVSSLFVWDIEVVGNSSVSSRTIKEELSKFGFGIGSHISSVNARQICNKVLAESDDLSWMSINFDGTVARVEVIEKLTVSDGVKSEISNIVSGYDAVISEVSLRHGHLYVKEGDIVKKGQILIGGIYDAAEKVVMVHADGSVIGSVSENITVKIKKEQTVKATTETKTESISLFFFGKEINIFSFSGNIDATYDKIYRENPIMLFGSIILPIYVNKTEYHIYSERKTTLTETQMIALATDRLYSEMAILLSDAELLTKTTNGYFSDDEYVLECSLEVLRDIGVNVDINK